MQGRTQTKTVDISSKKQARKLDISNFSTWLKGKKVGVSSMMIKLHYLPFFEQMQCGVMTELGLRRGKITIMKGFHFKTNPIVNELNELILNLDVGYDRISREQQILFKDEFFSDAEVSFELWRDVKSNLTKLDDILTDTNRRSTKTFIYSKKKELYEIQNTFLTLGETLMKGYNMNHQGCIGLYFRCLENLLKRGELDLNSLGFENNKQGKNRQRKLEIGLKYHKLSYDLLGEVLKKVLQKGLSDFHRKFIEFYLAHSYFRIPKFRVILLLSMENYMRKNNIDKDDLYTRNQSMYDMPLTHNRLNAPEMDSKKELQNRGLSTSNKKRNVRGLKSDGKQINIHHFDTVERFSAQKNVANHGDFETDVSQENSSQKFTKEKFRRQILKKTPKRGSGVFKVSLSKGNFEANDKLIKSFTQTDMELQESLNEISQMDLESPDLYRTNQEDDKMDLSDKKNFYKTTHDDSVEYKQHSKNKPSSYKPTRHQVKSRKRETTISSKIKKTGIISKKKDEEDRALEVDKLLDQSLYLEKPDKSMNFVLLSWEKDFYAHIAEVQGQFEEREKELLRMLAGDWRKKFNKKGIIFFFFIIEWCAYVKSTLVVKSISWSKIPGYHVILTRSLRTTFWM